MSIFCFYNLSWIKTVFFVLFLTISILSFTPKVAMANTSVVNGFFHSYNYGNGYWAKMTKYMESNWLEKKLYPKKKIQSYCGSLAQMAEEEYAIWYHNDKFHEIKDPEQGAAIQKMHDELIKVYDYFGPKTKQADLESCHAANEIIWPYVVKWGKKN